MAEETIILKLDIKTDKAVSDIKILREEQILLKKAIDDAVISNGLNSEAHIKAQAAYKANQKELTATTNVLTQLTEANKIEGNTVAKATAKNAELALAIKHTSTTTAEGAKRVAEMNAEINKNNEYIIANSDKLKQQRLQVGGYADGVKDALKQTGIWSNESQSAFSKLQSGAEVAKNVGSKIKDAFTSATKGAKETTQAAGGLAPAMQGGAAGTEVATKSMGGLKAGIAATGIGLLLLAFSALVSYFTKALEGSKTLKVAMAGIGAVVDTLGGVLIKTGKLLVDIFTFNFKDVANDIKEIGDNFKEIGENAKEAMDIQKAEFALTKHKRTALVEEAEITKEIAKARLDAADKTKTNEDRIKSLAFSLEAEKKLMKEKVDIANEELNAVHARIVLSEKEGKKANGDDKQRLAELVAARINAETEMYQSSKRATSQLTTLKNELAKEDKDRQDKANKEAEDARKKRADEAKREAISSAEFAYLSEKEFTQKRLDAQIVYLETKKKYELENENLTNSEKKLIEQKYKEDEFQITLAYNSHVAQLQIDALNEELRIFEDAHKNKLLTAESFNRQMYDDEIAINESITAQKQNILVQQLTDKLITEQQFDDQSRTLQNDSLAYTAQLNSEFKQKQTEEKQYQFQQDQELLSGSMLGEFDAKTNALLAQEEQEKVFANKTILTTKGKEDALENIRKKYDKAEKAVKLAKFQAELSLAGDFAKNIATIAGENTKVGKAAAVAATTISTIQGAVSSYTSVSSIPIVGPVLGIAAAAAALVSGYANVKKILSVQSGLPGDGGSSGGGGGEGAAVPSISAVAPTLAPSVNPSLGQGIVSRQVEDNSSATMQKAFSNALIENPLRPTLVTDDVTVLQNNNALKNKTSSI